MKEIGVKTRTRTELVDITDKTEEAVASFGVKKGWCVVYCPHTTAAVTVNESDDPAVAEDISDALNKLVPAGEHYKHQEGNADAHVKSAVVGSSRHIPVEGGKLRLGTWQGVFFCEFDGPRSRKVLVDVVGK